jgi:hypothetical protein
MASESCNSHEDSAVSQKDSDQTQIPPSEFVAVKVCYPKGELRRHRNLWLRTTTNGTAIAATLVMASFSQKILRAVTVQ